MTFDKTNTPDENAAAALGLEDKPSRRHVILRRAFLGISMILVANGALAYYQHNDEKAVLYKTAKVAMGNLEIKVTAAGTLEPVNQVVVGSELSGTIVDVFVDFNDKVTSGAVLARLNADQIETRITQARANLGAAKAKLHEEDANFTETKNEHERCIELSKRKLCPQQKADIAKAAYLRTMAKRAGALAQVEHAKATLAAGEMDLSKSMIRTPIDGIILNRNIEPGQTVASSFQTPDLFTIADDLRYMELHVDVDEADMGRVKELQHATFTVDAYPRQRFPAQIKQLRFAPQRVDGVVTYKALLKVENPDLLLRPGMTATADIITQKVVDALLVPNAALRFSVAETDMPDKAKKGGSMLAASMPWHSRRPPSKRPQSPRAGVSGKGKVWVLQDNKPVAISIVAGATDGRMTEVLKGDLEPGIELLVDILGAK